MLQVKRALIGLVPCFPDALTPDTVVRKPDTCPNARQLSSGVVVRALQDGASIVLLAKAGLRILSQETTGHRVCVWPARPAMIDISGELPICIDNETACKPPDQNAVVVRAALLAHDHKWRFDPGLVFCDCVVHSPMGWRDGEAECSLRVQAHFSLPLQEHSRFRMSAARVSTSIKSVRWGRHVRSKNIPLVIAVESWINGGASPGKVTSHLERR